MPTTPRPAPLVVEYRQGTTLVQLGDLPLLDTAAGQALGKHLFLVAEQAGAGQLLLDFLGTENFTSMLLALLVSLHKKMQAGGGRLTLCNLPPYLEEIFRTTRLDQILDVGDSFTRRPNRPAERPDVAIVLYDPQPVRAGQLVQALAPRLGAAHFTDLEACAQFCRRHEPAAVALPWPPSAAGERQDHAAVLQFIRAHSQRLPILCYGPIGRLPLEVYCRALAAGARQILEESSPTLAEDLRQALTHLIGLRQARGAEQKDLAAQFARRGLIGESPALQEVFRRAVRACQFNDLPVLILGETGTGKQRLAEAIHHLDPQRSQKPFLTLNCSALSKNLAESELFGHARGAFSGAQGDRLGLFRAAQGGTLLLDEIGELDLELQPKLLRVLQERRLLPVGADYEHTIDVRIMAATNQPLEKMVAEGTFREDLYQRLNVFQIRIPPLRERPDDVRVQARHFLHASQKGRSVLVTGFGPRVLEALALLPWEGNSRQLENLIRETLAHKEGGDVLQMEDLPRWVMERLAKLPAGALEVDLLDALAQRACEQRLSLSDAVAVYERRLLEVVLERNAGNRTQTGADLGLTPRSIFNKLKKHRLSPGTGAD